VNFDPEGLPQRSFEEDLVVKKFQSQPGDPPACARVDESWTPFGVHDFVQMPQKHLVPRLRLSVKALTENR
jgi:hypothetical protein